MASPISSTNMSNANNGVIVSNNPIAEVGSSSNTSSENVSWKFKKIYLKEMNNLSLKE